MLCTSQHSHFKNDLFTLFFSITRTIMSDTPSKDKPDSDLSKDAAIQEQRAEQPSDEVVEEQHSEQDKEPQRTLRP